MNGSKGTTLALRIPRSLCLALFLGAVFNVPAQPVAPFDLNNDIRTALAERDSFVLEQKAFKALLFKTGVPAMDSIRELLSAMPDRENPWQAFAQGLTGATTVPNEHFSHALSLALTRPGLTWLLFCEFHRQNKPPWMDSTLRLLHKQLLSRGATATPVVTQQLMHMAMIEKNPAQRHTLDTWAHSFDPHSVWPLVRLAVNSIPDQPQTTVSLVRQLLRLPGSQWRAQLGVVHFVLRWMSLTFLIVAIALVIPLVARRGREAIHPHAERYPQSVSLRLRQILTTILIVSPILLGLIPFILTLICVVWSRLERRERTPALTAMLLLTTLPVLSVITDCVGNAGAVDNAPALLAAAVTAGSNDNLNSAVLQGLNDRPNDPLLLAAAGIIAIKNDEPATARTYLAQALAQRPDDPVMLVTAAIADASAGDGVSARERLRICTRIYPRNGVALFNLGQCTIEDMETLDGMDLISRATRLDPVNVNLFMELNDLYFPNDRPSIRRFMFADYTPAFFWKSVFPRYCGDWKTTRAGWGNQFLGLPPQHGFVVLSVFLIILLIASFGPDPRQSRLRTLLSCEVCGTTMCRKCSKGLYCHGCFGQLRAIRDDHQRESIKQRIHSRAQMSSTVTAGALDVLLPGTGAMLSRAKTAIPPAATMAMMAALYAVIPCMISTNHAYPQWVARGTTLPLIILCVMIIAANGIRTVLRISGTMKTTGAHHGS